MKLLTTIWDFLKGRKTYIVAICGLIWAIYTGNISLIITCLGLLGLRDGINTAIANLIVSITWMLKS
jgi:hypothetical protein